MGVPRGVDEGVTLAVEVFVALAVGEGGLVGLGAEVKVAVAVDVSVGLGVTLTKGVGERKNVGVMLRVTEAVLVGDSVAVDCLAGDPATGRARARESTREVQRDAAATRGLAECIGAPDV